MAGRKARLSEDEAREYSSSLAKAATGDYELMDFAINTLDVPGALGMTPTDWVDSIGGYVRMSVEDRREAVGELHAEGKSNTQIATILGISRHTVIRDVEVLAVAQATPPAQIEGGIVAQATPKKQSVEEQRPEIRRLIDAGSSNAEIAHRLGRGVATIQKERSAYKAEQGESAYEKAKKAEEKRVANLTPAQKKEIEAAKDAITAPVRKALGSMGAVAVANYIDLATEGLAQIIADDAITVPIIGQIGQAFDRFATEFEVAKAMIGDWEEATS